MVFKYFIEFDRFIRAHLPFLRRDLLLPTREIGQLLRLLRFVVNSPLGALIPINIFVAGSAETSVLTRYLYTTFEPASIGVLQGLTDLTHGNPFCGEYGKDYFKEFEALQIPLLVVCADKDDLVNIKDSLQCFENSTSRDKAKLVYVAGEAETLAYGHTDILFGKHAVIHVWEKIRIWLDQRRKLGISGKAESSAELNEYYLPEVASSDLMLSSGDQVAAKEDPKPSLPPPTAAF